MSLQNSRLKEYYNLERAQDKYINKKRKITSIILKKLRIFFLSFFLFFLLILISASKSKKYKIAKVTIDHTHTDHLKESLKLTYIKTPQQAPPTTKQLRFG
jgi:ribonuclease BN (tRNA processing enzyme)